MVPKADAQIGIRVTGGWKKRLERRAEQEHRTVSNLIVKVLDVYMEQYERAGALSRPPCA